MGSEKGNLLYCGGPEKDRKICPYIKVHDKNASVVHLFWCMLDVQRMYVRLALKKAGLGVWL